MKTQKKCDCGTLYKSNLLFCENCGKPVNKQSAPPIEKDLSKSLICVCGTALTESALFCENCGKAVLNSSEIGKQNVPPIPQNIKKSGSVPPPPPPPPPVRAMPPLPKTSGSYGLQHRKKRTAITPPIPPGHPPSQYTGIGAKNNKSKTSTKWAVGTVLVSLAAIAVYFFLIKPTDSIEAKINLKPIKKGIIAQGVVNAENRILETQENVRMIISPITVAGDAVATITELKVPGNKHVEIVAYDFSLETDQPLRGVIQLEIPYDPNDLPKSMEPEECLVGGYYNEESEKWEWVDYEIDKTRNTLIINTTHLSTYGRIKYRRAPTQQEIEAGGYFDSDNYIAPTPNSKYKSRNVKHGFFYTENIGELTEKVNRIDMSKALEEAIRMNIVPSLRELSQVEPETETQALIELGQWITGTGLGITEHSSTTALFVGGAQSLNANRLLEIKENHSRLGWYVTLVQLGSDLYYKKSWSETIYNLVKGAVYRFGEEAVKALAAKSGYAVAGATAGPYVAIALVGFFTFEISRPFLLSLIPKYTFTFWSVNSKLFGAYQDYYNEPGIARNQRDWLNIIEKINKEALGAQSENKDKEFKRLLDKSIEEYLQEFWNSPQAVGFLVNSKTGLLYGDISRIHYDGTGSSTTISQFFSHLKTYNNYKFNRLIMGLEDQAEMNMTTPETIIDELLRKNGQVEISYSTNEIYASRWLKEIESGQHRFSGTIKNELNSNHKKEILKQIDDALREVVWENYTNAKTELHRNIEREKEVLNSLITLQYITPGPPSLSADFAGHWVVPVFQRKQLEWVKEKWAVKLNNKGGGSISFTTLAHMKAGGFGQIAVYPKGDFFDAQQTPLLLVDLKNIDNGINKVFLADSTIKVTILGDRLIEYELGEDETEYKHAFRARANPPDDYEFSWSFGDGNSTTDLRRKRRDSQVENSFKGGYFNVEVKLIDRKTGEELANDVVNVAVIEETQKYDLEECEKWTAARSGGYGTTMNYWDMGSLPDGAIIDFRFNAQSVPDKFVVKYEGNVVFDSGWRGVQSYINRNPGLYPGGLSGPGRGSVDGIFTKSRSNTFQVIVFGPESGTAWDYSFRARCSPPDQ